MLVNVSANLTKTAVTYEEGTSVVELPLSDWSVGKSGGHFLDCLLMWGGGTVNCAIPGLVGLGYVRKVSEQARK